MPLVRLASLIGRWRCVSAPSFRVLNSLCPAAPMPRSLSGGKGTGQEVVGDAHLGHFAAGLHIWRGTLDQAMGKGHSTLGHELSGEVIETGAEVGRFSKGDRVSMAYSASCGDCYQCRHHNTAHCQVTKSAVYGFGVGFGDLNGTQAEYMVIPHADAHTIKIDEALTDAQALTLSRVPLQAGQTKPSGQRPPSPHFVAPDLRG